MPPSIKVELLPYDPRWSAAARVEGERLISAIGSVIASVEHVGSTAIPGIYAKPILDLLPIVVDVEAFDAQRWVIESMGYRWWGELGLPGRRYCTMDDPASSSRLIQLHCYQTGSPEIVRHVAFRDYLRARPALAEEYSALKQRCRDLHPEDSHAYGDCKGNWIMRVEAEALAAFQNSEMTDRI